MQSQQTTLNASGTQLAAEAIFTKVFTCGTHIQDGYLAEVGTGLQGCQHRSAVVSDHLQAPPINDVHLLPHFACTQTHI